MPIKEFIDQLGNPIGISFPPQRIVSLVPSQTELLYDLGLDNRIVGITKFCVHPEHWRKTKTIVGGTKKFDFDVIRSLNPDLIIGNKEENYREGIEILARDYPVWISDIVTIQDALAMINEVGILTDQSKKSSHITETISNAFKTYQPLPPLRSLYLIWKNPWMAAASGTFIHEMMLLAGLQNCLADSPRYPELSSENIQTLNPELILLSSEPYPFKEKHIAELRQVASNAKILLVDGEMFSWYGSRLLHFASYVRTLRQQLC